MGGVIGHPGRQGGVITTPSLAAAADGTRAGIAPVSRPPAAVPHGFVIAAVWLGTAKTAIAVVWLATTGIAVAVVRLTTTGIAIVVVWGTTTASGIAAPAAS